MKIDILIIAMVLVSLNFIPVDSMAALRYDEIEAMFNDGRIDEAETILISEVRNNARDPVAQMLLGELYRKKGDRNTAMKYLNKAVSLDPEYPMPYFYRGKTLFFMQKPDEAANNFEIFMNKMKPLIKNNEDKSYYIGRLHDICHMYLSFKRYEDGKKYIDAVLKEEPKDQVAIYNNGIYNYMYERNRPAAYKCFSKAVEIDPNTGIAAKARYAIEFMRNNPDPRVEPDFDFLYK